jgi:elongation factor P
MGRGGAVVRIKAKNLITQKMLEMSLKGGDRFDEADLVRQRASFLYKDHEKAWFMDSETFEQYEFSLDRIGDSVNYLNEGALADILVFEGQPVSVEIPRKVELRVVETSEATRGNTAQGSVTKKAALETGFVVDVPLFIKVGNLLRINTDTGEYVERVTK